MVIRHSIVRKYLTKLWNMVENFEEYSVTEGIGSEATTSGKIYEYEPEHKVMMVAEDPVEYGKE